MQPILLMLLLSFNLHTTDTTQPYVDTAIYPIVQEVAVEYNVDPALIAAMIYKESTWDETATNKNCLGLMQIAPQWHQDRIKKLGVRNLLDAKDNITCGVDFMAELLQKYPTEEALMYYNSGHKGITLYEQGKISDYACSIMKIADTFRVQLKTETFIENWTMVKNTTYWERYE